MASNFIGARISLVSKSDIRYVGTLHSINQTDSTIALENVKSFGTETRKTGTEFIPESSATFEYILFRASDVKDLHVEEPAKAPAQRANAVPNDPAIISSSYTKPPPAPAPQVAAQPGPHDFMNNQQRVSHQNDRPAPFGQAPVADANRREGENHDTSNRTGHLPGMGGHLTQPRRGRGGRRYENNPRHTPRAPLPGTDFDFESSNAKFNKDELEQTPARRGSDASEETGDKQAAGSKDNDVASSPSSEVFYDKSSFFDNISCETKERQQMNDDGHQGVDRRAKQFEERRLNLETFGQMSVDNGRHRRNFRGGRGGGGHRGGYRGYGGGGGGDGSRGFRHGYGGRGGHGQRGNFGNHNAT